MNTTLNTKADYLFLKENNPESIWKPIFQSLFDNRNTWQITGQLDDPADGVISPTHRIQEVKDQSGTITGYLQEELMEDQNTKFFMIGFTTDEMIDILV